MRSLVNSALAALLPGASFAAKSPQASSPNSRKILAQKPAAKSGSGSEITPQQEQAILILSKLFERMKDFADDMARIKSQARIAETLWEHDQQTARRQFTEAFRSIERIERVFLIQSIKQRRSAGLP